MAYHPQYPRVARESYPTPAECAARLYREGKSAADIAQIMQVSASRVQRYLQMSGLR